MDTLQLPQPQNGGNGHAAMPCTHGKKPFLSREEAEQFEDANRKRFPNRGKQYAYKAPDCPFFHLSSKPPDAYAIGESNLKRLETLATGAVVQTAAHRGKRGETESDVKRLWQEGKSDREIVTELGVSDTSVYYHRKKFGAANSVGRKSLRQLPQSLSDVAQRKLALEEEFKANLQRLEQQEQRLAEANKLVVSECQEGRALFIKFGYHQQMMVPKEKVEELTERLMQWV